MQEERVENVEIEETKLLYQQRVLLLKSEESQKPEAAMVRVKGRVPQPKCA